MLHKVTEGKYTSCREPLKNRIAKGSTAAAAAATATEAATATAAATATIGYENRL